MEKELKSNLTYQSSGKDLSYLVRTLDREKRAKKEAERIIEVKSTELYESNRKLEQLNISLEKKVTERTKQLVSAMEKAEESAHAKERFLANMSHEIRTPMNAIIGFTDLMLKDETNETRHKYLNAIRTSSDNLLVLINDILDFSKIGAGKLELEFEQLDFRKVIEEVIYYFRKDAEEKDISLVYQIDDRIDNKLISDGIRLKQILINLLSNAVKFTQEGTVSLDCRLKEDMEEGQLLEFKITDTGIGIEKKNINKIFESFSQEDQSITKEFGGTGLGLAICLELVKLLDGEITVESEKNIGTTFKIIISMERPVELPQIKEIESRASEVLFDGLRILLAEDNEFNQLLIQSILNSHDVVLDIVSNGKQALEKLEINTYDIVLMDIQMPVMDGIETTRYIREKFKLGVPIIALTANALREDKEKYLLSGMTDYISKPFGEDELIGKIKIQTSNNDDKNFDKCTFNLSRLEGICGTDHQVYQKLLKKLIENNERLLDKVNMELKSGNLKGAKNTLHSMKNSITMIEAQPYLDIILKIESTDQSDDEELPGLHDRLVYYGKNLIHQLKELTSSSS